MIGRTRKTKRVGEVISAVRCKPQVARMKVTNAEYNFRNLLSYYLGREPQWLNGYDGIVRWLRDGENKGLLLCGNCGVGKSVIATQVIPYIVEKGSTREYIMPVYKARDLNDPHMFEQIKSSRFKVIDDIGTEPPNNSYGVYRFPFCEIVDIADEQGQFMVITTNLSIDKIRLRYGDRTFDRLRQLCYPVAIDGESLRGARN